MSPRSGAATGRRSPRLAPILVVAALLLVPMILLVECGHTEGQLSVRGGPHGDFVFQATDCHGLAPYGRFGANVHGDGHDDGAVYVTMDPITGPGVLIEVPGTCAHADGTDCTLFEVPRAGCGTFEVQVDSTSVTVNDVRLVRGHAELECALPDGTEVRGRVDFDGC